MIITLIKNQNNKLYNFIKNNKYLFLINHSKEDTENYKKKVLNVLNNEDFNKYLDLIEIIFPILNNINVSYDTKNKYISSLESFDYYFSISYQYEHFDNEIINAIDNILYNYGNFASSLKFLISKKKAIDFIDNFSLIINNNKDYFIINDYSTIILNLLSGYNSFNFTDNIENVILKEKIMFNMKILIKKLNLKQLTRLFSEHTIDTKRAILINHILEEETFEKIPRNKVLEINNKFKSIVEKDVVNYEFCSFDDDIITFKGNNNYEIIYNLTKQKINPKKLKQTLKNYNNYSKESFFNIIREFKTYIIKNDIYNIIIDKELLFQFVDEASINEYYNSIKISDLSIEEESLYKLY